MFETGKTKAQIESETRKAEALARLSEIDKETVRPLRAILSNDSPNQEDLDRLAALEAEAVEIREAGFSDITD